MCVSHTEDQGGQVGSVHTHTHIFWSPYAVPVLSDHSGVLCNIFSSPSPACVSAKLSGTSEPVPPEFLWWWREKLWGNWWCHLMNTSQKPPTVHPNKQTDAATVLYCHLSFFPVLLLLCWINWALEIIQFCVNMVWWSAILRFKTSAAYLLGRRLCIGPVTSS